MIGVAVGTMALIIVLSVFNGLEDLIRQSYSTFDPEIKIVPKKGKTFHLEEDTIRSLKKVPGVAIVTEVAEDNALVKYQDAQMIVTLKGVSDNFIEQSPMERAIVSGELKLREGSQQFAILGRGVQYTLSVPPSNDFYTLKAYYPNRNPSSAFNPGGSYYNRKNIMPGGVFAIEKQFDAKYIIVPLEFAADLFEYGEERTALEIKTKPEYDISKIQENIKKIVGEDFEVLNSDQQHASLLRAIKIEKLFVYITFSFILAIASFNIFFSLSMLALDKKKDLAMFFAMGASSGIIKKIFLYEGGVIAFSGAIFGLATGILICWVQQTFGIVSMGMQTSIVDAYPVKMQFNDILFTTLSIIIITLLASWRPAVLASRIDVKDNL